MSSESPIATFEVRTAPGYWLVGGALVVLAGLGAAMLAFLAATTSVPGAVAVALAGVAAVAPVVYWALTPAYRIGGGRGAIKLFADHLEVPSARSGPPVVFPRDALVARATELRIRYRVGAIQAATLRRGHLVDLDAGGTHRTLSTMTVEQPKAFLAALDRYLTPAAGDSA